jgi:quercetin dioxygenase-like cupin family protein
MEVYTKVENLTWKPHPLAEGVYIKPLVTKKADGLNVSCILVKIPVGVDIPEHVHAEQVDILYPLGGNAEMYVEGTGTFKLAPGMVVRVPIGVRHKIFNVTEEVLIYDVFHPATI